MLINNQQHFGPRQINIIILHIATANTRCSKKGSRPRKFIYYK